NVDGLLDAVPALWKVLEADQRLFEVGHRLTVARPTLAQPCGGDPLRTGAPRPQAPSRGPGPRRAGHRRSIRATPRIPRPRRVPPDARTPPRRRGPCAGPWRPAAACLGLGLSSRLSPLDGRYGRPARLRATRPYSRR